ncbi:ketoacyl-ACP synthase III family protein [Streptomyces sp. NPDC002520]
MRTPNVFISALGSYLPEITPMEWAVERGLTNAEDAARDGITGVAMAGELSAPDMALRATRQALERWQGDPSSLSLLLYASTWYQGPHAWSPQYYIQHHTGSGAATSAEIRQGCMGVFGAMELSATHLMATDQHKAALITAADNYNSPLLDRWRSSPGSVFGDGACALVLTSAGGFARLASINSVTLPEYDTRHRGPGPLFPPGATLRETKLDLAAAKDHWKRTAPRTSDLGSKMASTQQQVVDRTLDEAGIDMKDITKVAFVNWTRERVEERAAAPLGIEMSRTTWSYGRTIGHVGASDQTLSFEHLVTTGELKPGDWLLMLGSGPGANIAAAAIEILEEPDWAAGQG